ncbi:MAG: aminodeoxychorismate/anthranilate synthase component II [Pseudomonadota bacterium]
MILMIDNYDSFTYNLVQYCGELGQEVLVRRNDTVSIEEIKELHPDQIIISPGPCTPREAGVSVATVKEFSGHLPILGVCLGHQSIGFANGANIVHAKAVMHGKTSNIFHNGEGVFANLSNPFVATRYHSLVIEHGSLSDAFEICAWTQNENGGLDEIMGIRHVQQTVHGVQFHPESILTEHGHQLLKNFIAMS